MCLELRHSRLAPLIGQSKDIRCHLFSKKNKSAWPPWHSVKPNNRRPSVGWDPVPSKIFDDTVDWMARYGQPLPASAGMTNIWRVAQMVSSHVYPHACVRIP